MAGDRSNRILSVNSFLAPNKSQRMHKGGGSRQGFETDDSDSYFRAPRSRFDRVAEKPRGGLQ